MIGWMIFFIVQPEFYGGYSLTWHGSAPLVQAQVPAECFSLLQSANWKDLAVVNGQGEQVPMTLEIRGPLEEMVHWTTFEVTPIPDVDTNHLETLSIYWGNNRLKTWATSKKEDTGDYLVDLGENEVAFEQIRFQMDDKATGIGKAQIWASSDLETWNSLGGGTLCRLGTSGPTIVRDRLKIGGGKGRFLFIRSRSLGLKSIEVGHTTQKQPDLFWTEPVLPEKSDEESLLAYKLKGFPPICAVKPVFKQMNSSASFVLYAQSPEGERVAMTRGFAFRFACEDCDSGELVSENEFRFYRSNQWFLDLKDRETRLGQDMPGIEFGFASVVVRFIPRGNPPFRLMAGSAQIVDPKEGKSISDPRAAPFEKLSNSLIPEGLDTLQTKWAAVGPWKVLSGEKAFVPLAEPLPIRTIVLWCVLVLSVVILLWLALKLVKGEPS